MNDELNLSFVISFEDLPSFIEHWAGLYSDDDETYENNIDQELTLQSRQELFEWKNGGKISAGKTKSIEDNYPLEPPVQNDLENRYLNHNEAGGAIWNIFYLHIISPQKYPIFDQHVYRAVHFMQTGQLDELPDSSSKEKKSIVYEKYEDYRKFYKDIESKTRGRIDIKDDSHGRKIDRALFTFGQFLKKVKRYQRTD